ncbi:hypothetical protein Poli38472_011972 [Pythium oligandrum]|uniref:Protein kinase domain-containing protein n=1 Tax=Pythium oligandrum TaxID=41045 RepID=A0A8K1FL79_PYTOL|nr:hypothetical protein Poli38472_011972 [Pythium oligandrum]|eukprot:TMW66856.1 hypothetical protein Poli38472_011972 [Pythium oligandrum]
MSVTLNPDFKWDGTTSDLAEQYYRLYRRQIGDGSVKVSVKEPAAMLMKHNDLPATIRNRLEDYGLNFDRLSPYLQRALVWDSGYVLANSRDLRRVYTLGGRNMADIAVSLHEFRVAGCSARNCSSVYRSQFCSGTQIISAAKCITEDVLTPAIHVSMWATGGEPTMLPEMTLLRHSWVDANDTYLMYAIHTVAEEHQPAWGACPDPELNEQSGLIIPCGVYEADTNTSLWKLPEHGDLVSSWLQEAARHQRTSFRMVYIAPIVGGVVVILLVLVWWRHRRRRAYQRSRTTKSQDLDDVILGVDGQVLPKGGGKREEIFLSTSTPTGFIPSFDPLDTMMNNSVMDTLVHDSNLNTKRMVFEQFNFNRLIAKGAFGEVWLASYNGAEYAIKRLIQSNCMTYQDLDDFVDEIRITASLKHENIIQFVGVAWRCLENLCMVCEYLPNGDLQGYLTERRDTLMGCWTSEKLQIALGIARAIAYLHDNNPPMIHRDIKTKNVLLAEDMSPRLIDFGISRLRRADLTMTGGIGTPYWTAPEVLAGVRYSEKSDIFSYGVLLTELETCHSPYHDYSEPTTGFDKSLTLGERLSSTAGDLTPSPAVAGKLQPFQILKLVMNGSLRPSVTLACPAWLKQLTQACFSATPSERPTAAELVAILEQQLG